jgi:hypothetical protein
VGSVTPHNHIGLHGLLQGQVYFTFQLKCASVICKESRDKAVGTVTGYGTGRQRRGRSSSFRGGNILLFSASGVHPAYPTGTGGDFLGGKVAGA